MKDSFSVAGKVIIVTGAAGNLGSSYVRSLSAEGAIVYGWDIDETKLQEALLPCMSDTCRGVVVNVCDEDRVVQVVEDVLKIHGRIDGLVNNAAMNPAIGVESGINLFAPYEEYSIDLFRKEIDANITSMMITIKAVAPAMMSAKSGSIINVASEVSTAAHDHRVYQTPGKYKSPGYVTSKAAVLGLTRQWAARLGESGVRVNAVSIGGVKSANVPEDFATRFGNMNMLMRMARPDEYDATIQYLLSDASTFMTGANVQLDGGKTSW